VQLLPVQRSILNEVSLSELSVQEILVVVPEVAEPVRLLGAFGAPDGVGVGVGVAVGVGDGVGVAVGVAVGVGVGVGDPPQPGNLNEPMRVRQLKLVVVV